MITPKTFLNNLSKSGRPYWRTLSLLVAIVAGILLPQAAEFSYLIQYAVFLMLFLSFVGLHFERSALRPNLFGVLLANVCVALVAFFGLRPVDETLALAGFMAAISPTGISASVVMSLLKRRVDYIVTAILLTNVGIALIIPFLLPWLAGRQIEISMWEVLWSVAKIVLLPLILARLVVYLPQPVQKSFYRAKGLTFALWMSSLFLIVAKAAHFICNNASVPLAFLLQIAAISLVLCIINFSLGALLSGREFRRETSQALGHKNLSFTIWLALTFINPVVALGPTFYIIFHNTYNFFQLYQFSKEEQHNIP